MTLRDVNPNVASELRDAAKKIAGVYEWCSADGCYYRDDDGTVVLIVGCDVSSSQS